MAGDTLGERVAYFRRHSGLTQKALAQRLEVTQGYIHQIESGRRVTENISAITALAIALGVSPHELDPRLAPSFEAP